MASQTVLAVLQHALGVDEFGRSRQYRNHFVCGEGHDSYEACCAAVEQGLMIRRESAMFGANGSLFLVNDAGRAWMAANSPPPPKLTRGQRRYAAYLDADSSMTFGEWLRTPWAAAAVAACLATPHGTDAEVPF